MKRSSIFEDGDGYELVDLTIADGKIREHIWGGTTTVENALAMLRESGRMLTDESAAKVLAWIRAGRP